MTGSSSKLLQIQGKWYRERKPKKIQNLRQKDPKTILHPYKQGLWSGQRGQLRCQSWIGAPEPDDQPCFKRKRAILSPKSAVQSRGFLGKSCCVGPHLPSNFTPVVVAETPRQSSWLGLWLRSHCMGSFFFATLVIALLIGERQRRDSDPNGSKGHSSCPIGFRVAINHHFAKIPPFVVLKSPSLSLKILKEPWCSHWSTPSSLWCGP